MLHIFNTLVRFCPMFEIKLTLRFEVTKNVFSVNLISNSFLNITTTLVLFRASRYTKHVCWYEKCLFGNIFSPLFFFFRFQGRLIDSPSLSIFRSPSSTKALTIYLWNYCQHLSAFPLHWLLFSNFLIITSYTVEKLTINEMSTANLHSFIPFSTSFLFFVFCHLNKSLLI